MPSRTDLLAAQLERLALVVQDANDGKANGAGTVGEYRQAQVDALTEVLDAGTPGEVENVSLPSDRVES